MILFILRQMKLIQFNMHILAENKQKSLRL